jgi:hypothetical protein
MSLLEKAKVITTPTAYSEGILHSVKPINGDADFTFTRNSSATRVGEDGYIQDVQIIGGELVQNGDFEEIGSELVTNGSFDTDSDWSKGTGWTISGGVASHSGGTASYLSQAVLEASKTYRVLIKVVSADASNFVQIYMGGSPASATITSVGEYEYTFTSQSSVPLGFAIRGFGDVSIDNVSVKEVGQNWSFIGDFETDGTKAFITSASQYSQLTNQLGVNYLLSGRKYRLSFDIPTLSISNAFAYRYTGGSIVPISTSDIQNGRFTTDFVMPSNGYFWLQTTGSYTGLNVELDNVSVKEITDDTNLPRINYEGFQYDNGLPIYGSGKGHLLLEGQSTNLALYSEQFDNVAWTKSGVTVTANQAISPDGYQNADKVTNATSLDFISQIIGPTPTATAYATSFYIKNEDSTTTGILVRNAANSLGGAINWNGSELVSITSVVNGTLTFESVGNDWYKIFGNFTSVETIQRVRISPDATASGKSVYLWGFQLEQGATYATSYIPTNGSAVTRAAETCNNAGNADLFGQGQGVFYVDFKYLDGQGSNNENWFALESDTGNSRVLFYKGETTNQRVLITNNSSTIYTKSNLFPINANERYKLAVRYDSGNISVFLNGNQIATDTTTYTSAENLTNITLNESNQVAISKINMIATFSEGLSNDEMECLTTI